jgi:hypothetical protein
MRRGVAQGVRAAAARPRLYASTRVYPTTSASNAEAARPRALPARSTAMICRAWRRVSARQRPQTPGGAAGGNAPPQRARARAAPRRACGSFSTEEPATTA